MSKWSEEFERSYPTVGDVKKRTMQLKKYKSKNLKIRKLKVRKKFDPNQLLKSIHG